MNDPSELLDQYLSEVQQETTLDEVNLNEQQQLLPSYRAKWVGRLIRAKQARNKLHRLRNHQIDEAVAQTSGSVPVKTSKTSQLATANKAPSVKKINQMINDYDLLIDYLERVEKIFGTMNFDVKNLIELIKLETL